VPLERHVRRSTTEVAGSLPRRAQDGCPVTAAACPSRPRSRETAHSNSRTGARKWCRQYVTLSDRGRRERRTSTPERVPDHLDRVAHPDRNRDELDDRCARTGARSLCRHVAPAAETVEVPQQLRSDGCPIALPHVAPAAETVEVPQQLRSDGCPTAVGASPLAAETAGRSATTTSGRCPIAATTSPPRPKPWRSRDSCARTVPKCRWHFAPPSRNRTEVRVADARTGARVPKVPCLWRPKPLEAPHVRARTGARLPTLRHSLPPKRRKEARHRRPDGCPFADAASLPATEAAERGATSTPGRVPSCRRVIHALRPKPKGDPHIRSQTPCPFANGTPPSPTEAEADAATSTPGRCPIAVDASELVPVCRRRLTPSSRNRREIRDLDSRTGARLPPPPHPLQPKPKRDPRPRLPDGCPFADPAPRPPTETERCLAAPTPGRVPVCRPRSGPHQPKPTGALAAPTPGRVPGRHSPINPSQPKLPAVSRTARPGR